jgi:2-amino-4-hydroxy-6-hydroxymethyldihydropteridine diphosphokinase
VRLAGLLEDAASGRLPDWSQVSEQRFAHMRRVSSLLGDWADALDLAPPDRVRWRAAGYLHDALRETPPDELRPLVDDALKDVAGKLLHGPAAAVRLRADGIDDEDFLRAVAYHTIGHPDLEELGRALFIADYIEPGRRYEPQRLATLRARMPAARDDVLRDVLRSRIDRLLRDGRPMRPETVAFWNVVNGVTAHA